MELGRNRRVLARQLYVCSAAWARLFCCLSGLCFEEPPKMTRRPCGRRSNMRKAGPQGAIGD